MSKLQTNMNVSDQHPYFLDVRKRVDSPYYDWFYFNEWPNDYLCFLSVKSLPKLNLDNLISTDCKYL
jgi:hypothetical protein